MSCVAGKYSVSDGSTLCTSCNPGYYSNVGSSDCNYCPTGKYGADDRSTCVVCPAGKYSSSTAVTSITGCNLCNEGSYSLEGSGSCSLCPAGRYVNHKGGTSISDCTLCPAGQYSSISGSSSCSLCPAGKYSNTAGSSSDSLCYTCSTGKYSLSGSSSCSLCPLGKYSNEGTNAQDGCAACPRGTYADAIGSSVCKDCSLGSVSTVIGALDSSVCTTCAAGKYANNKQECLSCAKGKYSITAGNYDVASCLSCPQGKYSDVVSSTGCQLCAAGKYSNAIEATSSSTCIDCSAGYYTDSAGQGSCTKCPVDSYSYVGKTSCLSCPGGSKSNTGSSYCYYESPHPYQDTSGNMDTPVFYVQGVDKYSLTFSALTSIEICEGGCDNVYIMNPQNVVLFTYRPDFANNTYELTAPSGFFVRLQTDESSNKPYYGYYLTIIPKASNIPTMSPTFTPTFVPTYAPSYITTTKPSTLSNIPTIKPTKPNNNYNKYPTQAPVYTDNPKFDIGLTVMGIDYDSFISDQPLQDAFKDATIMTLNLPSETSSINIKSSERSFSSVKASMLMLDKPIRSFLTSSFVVVFEIVSSSVKTGSDINTMRSQFDSKLKDNTFAGNLNTCAQNSGNAQTIQQVSGSSYDVYHTKDATNKTGTSVLSGGVIAAIVLSVFVGLVMCYSCSSSKRMKSCTKDALIDISG